MSLELPGKPEVKSDGGDGEIIPEFSIHPDDFIEEIGSPDKTGWQETDLGVVNGGAKFVIPVCVYQRPRPESGIGIKSGDFPAVMVSRPENNAKVGPPVCIGNSLMGKISWKKRDSHLSAQADAPRTRLPDALVIMHQDGRAKTAAPEIGYPRAKTEPQDAGTCTRRVNGPLPADGLNSNSGSNH